MKKEQDPPVIIPVSLGFVQVYIVIHNGVMIFDTGIPGSEQTILKVLKEQGISPEEVTIIVLSHGHTDHAGSVRVLQEKTGAPVTVHESDVEKLREGKQGDLKPISLAGTLLRPLFNRGKRAVYPPAEPDIIVDKPFELDNFGIEGTLIPTPGHTKGSVSVALRSGERFTGDLIFPTIPSNKAGTPFWAEEPDLILPSIKQLMEDEPTIFYTGHGGPFTSQDVLEMVERLEKANTIQKK